MEKIKIRTTKHEVKYKGLYFPFILLKRYILTENKKEFFKKYTIHKSFDKETGKILYKYAWESIFLDMKDDGSLANLLDRIIQNEFLD